MLGSWLTLLAIGFHTCIALPAQGVLVTSTDDYIFNARARVVGQGDPNQVFEMNVGEKTGIYYSVEVIDRKTNKVVCPEEPLRPLGPPDVNPPNQLFRFSSYKPTTESGVEPFNRFPTGNPFLFVPWYGGKVQVVMMGMACQPYHQEPWVLTSTLEVSDAAAISGKPHTCPKIPMIASTGFTATLEWSDEKTGSGCEFELVALNQLTRKASFAAVQTIVEWENTIVDETGHVISLINNPVRLGDPPLLDSPDGKELAASLAQVKDVQPNMFGFMTVADIPNMSLTKYGCWRVKKGKKRRFTSATLKLSFKIHVLQDYNLVDDPGFAQTPIGGPKSVYTWGIYMKANMDRFGKWAIDPNSKLQTPALVNAEPNYNPTWSRWAKEKGRFKAEWIDGDDCWEFDEEPAFLQNLRDDL